MFEKVFLQILNMSFTAGFAIILVLVARLMLKKLPKILSYCLWAVVLFRLICPFSFESILSFFPEKTSPISIDKIYETITTSGIYIKPISNITNQLTPTIVPNVSSNPQQTWILVGAIVWILGISILMIYSIISLVKLRKRLKYAVHEKDNIYLAEKLDTPFVMGIISPKIYLPTSLSGDEKRYILLHEQIHIKRFDHIIKILSFFVLCLHWFNPLVWLAFFCSSKDMEMSCDETVIKQLGANVKKEYSTSLLTLTTGKRIIGGTYLAFGEGNTKGRIKNVLNYKKPSFWIIVVAVIAVVVISFGLFANPANNVTLPNIEGMNISSKLLDKATYATFINNDKHIDVPKEKTLEIVDFIKKLKISKKEVSKNRNENRDKTYQINLFYEVYNNNTNDLIFNFNADFTEVWLDNGVKPSLSYKVKNPNEVKAIFFRYLNNGAKVMKIANIEQLWNARTKYLGDNSAVGKLLHLLPLPSGLQQKEFHLLTKSNQYGIRWLFDSYEGIDYHADDFNLASLLAFTLVNNLEDFYVVTVDTSGNETEFYFSRKWANDIVGEDIRMYAESSEKLQELVDFYNMIPSIDSFEKAIHNAIIENNIKNYQGSIALESHVILATERTNKSDNNLGNDIITVYAMVLYNEFNLVDGKFDGSEMESASHIPTSISFNIDTNGKYILREYWQPRSGSYYKTDIEEKFPKKTWKDALDTQKFITVQMQNIYQQLVESNYVNADLMITSIIEDILQMTEDTSNWKLQAKKRELIYYCDYMLRYAYARFLEANQSDKKAKIMESACRTILKQYNEDIDIASKTGQDWFDAYLATIKAYVNKEGMDYVKENMPKAYWLLLMLE